MFLNVQEDVLIEAKRQKILELSLQHCYRPYATTLGAVDRLSFIDLSASQVKRFKRGLVFYL